MGKKFKNYTTRRPKKDAAANGKTKEERRATMHFENYTFENVTDL